MFSDVTIAVGEKWMLHRCGEHPSSDYIGAVSVFFDVVSYCVIECALGGTLYHSPPDLGLLDETVAPTTDIGSALYFGCCQLSAGWMIGTRGRLCSRKLVAISSSRSSREQLNSQDDRHWFDLIKLGKAHKSSLFCRESFSPS